MRLTKRLRNTIHDELVAAGLGGNKRFAKPDRGYAAAQDVLADFGIEINEVVSAWQFQPKSGRTTIELAWSNLDDPFSPEAIPDTMLVLSWHELHARKYEVIAYLS